MLLSVTKDFALHYIARQAAIDRVKTGRDHKATVALYYIARLARIDLHLNYGRPASSKKAT